MLISEALHSLLDLVESMGGECCVLQQLLLVTMNYEEGSRDAKNDKHKGGIYRSWANLLTHVSINWKTDFDIESNSDCLIVGQRYQVILNRDF